MVLGAAGGNGVVNSGSGAGTNVAGEEDEEEEDEDEDEVSGRLCSFAAWSTWNAMPRFLALYRWSSIEASGWVHGELSEGGSM